MKDYYNLFVKLSLQMCSRDDYKDKQKVKAHNAAVKKIQHLQGEMKDSSNIETFRMLLSHDDDRVRVNAASSCLQMSILVDEARMTLQNIVDFSNDPTVCFSARMLLQSISGEKS